MVENTIKVEFSNENGETTALCPLSPQQFIVVWQAITKSWLSVSDKLTALINTLSSDKQQEVFNFARFLHQVGSIKN